MRSIKLAVLAFFLLIPLVVVAPAAQAANQTISGTVTCINWWQQYSKPVGIWVDSSKGKDGWATLSAGTGAKGAWTSSFTYTTDNPEKFTLHIGCGGTPQRWQTTNQRGPYGPGKQNLEVRY